MTVSVADLNASLDTQGLGTKAKAIKSIEASPDTLFYVLGGSDYVGQAKWCKVTAALTTAQQVSVVRATMANRNI